MRAADHSECDPAECIHRAAQDVKPQLREMHGELARNRQDKERHVRKHPDQERSEAAFEEAYGGPVPAREDAYYEQKRRAKLQDGVMKVTHIPTGTSFGSMHVAFDTEESAQDARLRRLQELEMALLAQREEMVRHGDSMPLQELRNVVGDALRLAEHKQQRYGDAWRKNGYMGNLARIKSKTDRLDNMLWRDAEGNGYPIPRVDVAGGEETVIDTLLDLINMAGFMAINWTEENRWGRS